jgi:hypothetical protein
MQRTIPPRKNSLRLELEAYVIAWNNCLKKAVETMDLITLLRNSHPTFRPDFAAKLKDAGMISPFEASEFVKIVGR